MQKRQHTVPRCYLQHFTDADGFVWVLDTKDKIFRIKPENILVENHFYTITLKNGEKSVIVEDTLAKIEGEYSTIFEQKLSKDIFLTAEERAKVSIFIAALYLRTSPYRESLKGAFTQLKTGMEDWKKQFEANPHAKRMAQNTPSSGDSITLGELDQYLDNFNEEHSVSMITQLPKIAQIIFDMKWSIWKDKNNNFVTSDNPLVLLRPLSIKRYGPNAIGSRPGLLFKDVELTLPLSKDRLLLAGWILNEDSYFSVEGDKVRNINYRTITHSSKKVITKSKKDAEAVRDRYTETKDKQNE